MPDPEPTGRPDHSGEGEPPRPEAGESPRSPAGRRAAGMRRIGDAWMIAWILPAAIGIGYLSGWGLDHLLGTGPWCTAVFSAIGVAAGFREVIRIALRVGREEDEAARRGRDAP